MIEAQEKADALRATREASNRALRTQLEAVRAKFVAALRTNQQANQQDAVPRRDFCVEYEVRDALVAKGDALVP